MSARAHAGGGREVKAFAPYLDYAVESHAAAGTRTAPSPGTAGLGGANMLNMDAVHLHIVVRRCGGSLGFAVNRDNIVVDINADGQASRDGLLQAGDLVLAVDGVPLNGALMPQVLRKEQDIYNFVILRQDDALQASLGRLLPGHPATECDVPLELLRVKLTRNSANESLGLDMTGANNLKRIVPGGPADRCGALQLNDVVVAVDGIKLGMKKVVDVLSRGAPSVVFTIIRAPHPEDALDYSAGPPAALSFLASQPSAGPASQFLHPEMETKTNSGEAVVEVKSPLDEEPTAGELLAFILDLQGLDRQTVLGMWRSAQSARTRGHDIDDGDDDDGDDDDGDEEGNGNTSNDDAGIDGIASISAAAEPMAAADAAGQDDVHNDKGGPVASGAADASGEPRAAPGGEAGAEALVGPEATAANAALEGEASKAAAEQQRY
eukprot:6190767-Pleurochrysis_carterae.AAC.3